MPSGLIIVNRKNNPVVTYKSSLFYIGLFVYEVCLNTIRIRNSFYCGYKTNFQPHKTLPTSQYLIFRCNQLLSVLKKNLQGRE